MKLPHRLSPNDILPDAHILHSEVVGRMEATVWSVPRHSTCEVVVTLVRHLDEPVTLAMTHEFRPEDLPAASEAIYLVEKWIADHEDQASTGSSS